MKSGAELIAEERQRQINEEGWVAEHDDRYKLYELPRAALCYLTQDLTNLVGLFEWPWDKSWFKPTSRIRNLTKAGALIAAEIDRLQRVQYHA